LATGPGVIAILASSIATENAAIATFDVLAIVFVTLTSPVSSHAIARVTHRRGIRNLPEPADRSHGTGEDSGPEDPAA
jgi:monovalent cation/proton antiporter MnhG/PhaG subunit